MSIETRRPQLRELSELIELHVSELPDELQSETREELRRKTACNLTDISHSRIIVENTRVIAWLFVEKHVDTSWQFQLPQIVSRKDTTPESARAIRRALLADLRADFDDGNGWIAQSLLPGEKAGDAAILGECGFPELTNLSFMTRDADHGLPDIPPGDWAFEHWTEENATRFAAAIEKTYDGTRDCHELNGCRTGEQALTSHKLSGVFQPKLWRVYSENGDDVGIALLSPHRNDPDSRSLEPSEQRVWEIVYLGVATSHRNRGLGKRMLADLLQLACDGGADEVMLGVDIRNGPALQLYRAFGFREFDQRAVHARLRRPD